MDPPIDWDLPRDNPVIGDMCDKGDTKEITTVTNQTLWSLPRPCKKKRVIRAASSFDHSAVSVISAFFVSKIFADWFLVLARSITRFRNLEVSF